MLWVQVPFFEPFFRESPNGRVTKKCLVYIEAWCNGNTKDFDSFVVGSSPAASANAAPADGLNK